MIGGCRLPAQGLGPLLHLVEVHDTRRILGFFLGPIVFIASIRSRANLVAAGEYSAVFSIHRFPPPPLVPAVAAPNEGSDRWRVSIDETTLA